MATKIGRCLYAFSRLSSSSLRRPFGVTSYAISPLAQKQRPVRRYSDKSMQFNEPAGNYRYTNDHEWVSMDGDTATIGISNHAQEKLGDVVFVELPEVGSDVCKGDQLGVLESVKAAADYNSPLTGCVVEVNTTLEEEPELINKSPYTQGWLFKLGRVNKAEYDDLLSPNEYEKFINDSA